MKYFISYFMENSVQNKYPKFGNAVIEVDEPINSAKSLNNLRETIEERYENKNAPLFSYKITILNFQKLD